MLVLPVLELVLLVLLALRLAVLCLLSQHSVRARGLPRCSAP
jgi:hypothetical protein